MIMAIDVSNTNITLGTFKGEKLLKIYRVTTKVPRTSDEYGVLLRDLVRLSNASHHDIEGVIIASVVPESSHQGLLSAHRQSEASVHMPMRSQS